MTNVLVWGHRGSPEKEVENTIPSFLQAVEDGADGVELDVQMTRDNQVVVFHDGNLTRLAGRPEDISMLDLDELQSIELKAAGLAPGRIPTLEEVLQAVPKELLIQVELKGSTREPDSLEAAVVEMLARYGPHERYAMASFNPVRLRTLRNLEPHLKRAFIHSSDLRVFPSRTMIRVAGKIDGVHPHNSLVDEEFIAEARARGLYVNGWPVDDEDTLRRMLDLGVDWATTNRPDVIRSLLG